MDSFLPFDLLIVLLGRPPRPLLSQGPRCAAWLGASGGDALVERSAAQWYCIRVGVVYEFKACHTCSGRKLRC
jgi:hypothetical protein